MRYSSAFFIGIVVIAGLAVWAQEKTPPAKLVFEAKTGDVTYDHAAHAKREKADCKECHDQLWPQSAKAPLNFRAAMHKTAEAKHTSCGSCHYAGGKAFESKGNCKRCHVKGGAKPDAPKS
jgi:c(7)-type cytochrome triheme protein